MAILHIIHNNSLSYLFSLIFTFSKKANKTKHALMYLLELASPLLLCYFFGSLTFEPLNVEVILRVVFY